MTNELVLCIGNVDRGDDAVGHIVANLLRPRVPTDVRIIEQVGEATAVLSALQTASHVWLIDAAQSGSPPGTIHRVDCATADAPIPRGSVSSHGFGLAEAIALARVFGALPPHCVIYAVEAADFTAGAPLSPAVARAAKDVAERILAELILTVCSH